MIINSHNFTPPSTLLTDLVWWWDLDTAPTSLVDQQSGLTLTKGGTVTVVSGVAPDGGDCISTGAAAGWYANASVSRTIDTNVSFAINIWGYSTADSSTGNWLISHRNAATTAFHWQMIARLASNTSDGVDLFDAAGNYRGAYASRASQNAWHMFTIVADPALLTLYVDGTSVATSSASLGARATAAQPFAIGTASWVAGNSAFTHRGRLAMAGVWGKGLTTTEITSLYNGGAGRRFADL